MRTLGMWLLLGMGIVGCARHVVVRPEEVPSLSDTDWKVTSEPARAVPQRKPEKDPGENHD